MAYTEVTGLADHDRFTRDQANAFIHDNLEALRNPPTALYVTSGRSTNYSTSSTSFVDVDTTNMTLTVTSTGDGTGGNSSVFLGFCGTVYGNAQIYFRVLKNGVTAIGADDGIIVIEANGGGVRPASFLFPVDLGAGTHTFALQWKVASGTGELMANVGTSGRDCKAMFFARELT